MSGQQMADGGVCARLAAGVVSGWSPNLPTDLAALKLLAPAVAEHLGDRLGGHRAPVRGALGFQPVARPFGDQEADQPQPAGLIDSFRE